MRYLSVSPVPGQPPNEQPVLVAVVTIGYKLISVKFIACHGGSALQPMVINQQSVANIVKRG